MIEKKRFKWRDCYIPESMRIECTKNPCLGSEKFSSHLKIFISPNSRVNVPNHRLFSLRQGLSPSTIHLLNTHLIISIDLLNYYDHSQAQRFLCCLGHYALEKNNNKDHSNHRGSSRIYRTSHSHCFTSHSREH